ncbi:MAG TPA: T9SS type A sorting domain-containing protein, partial [Bacteroidia bacterium]|nr:T9SS type A sorting domain-containing protein [Bacteroidia bacterium]
TSAKADCSTSDGSASVSVTGGVSPYTYAWSTGATATNITNVSAGVYEVSITDKNGCVDSAHIAVSNKTGPSVSISIAGNANCGNGGIVSVTATGGTSPYTYMWSNGATATDITNIPAGVYTVSVTDKLGCIGTADTTVTEVLPPVIPLCIVTVDPTMNKNVILWDNPIVGSSNISYYNVYKESTKAGVYFKVAQVPYDSLSQFVDTLSNPSVRSWRYELSQVDTCGNESPLSPAHKTMHVTVNQGLGNTINLIWDNYEGLAFSTYYVYRDTNYNKFTLLDSIPNNIFTYTDGHPLNTYQPVYYRIGIDYPTGCTPHTKAKTYNASHSNTANTIVLSTNNLNIGSDALNIYPNPNNGKFTFELKTTKSEMLRIDIYNMIGEKIYSEDCGKVLGIMTKQMDLSAYSKGVYFVKVVSDNNVYNRRVVVQ